MQLSGGPRLKPIDRRVLLTLVGMEDEMKRKTKIKLELKWQDIWVGAYWKIEKIPHRGTIYPGAKYFHIWICVVPCLPIHIWWKINE